MAGAGTPAAPRPRPVRRDTLSLLIGQARERRRRRVTLLLVLVGMAVAGAAFGLHRSRSNPPTAGLRELPVRAVLAAREPMIGLACTTPNRTRCGRVGVAVWLRRPARGVRATIGGRTVVLHAGGLGGRGPTYWEGYVRPAPGTVHVPSGWTGSPARLLPVRLRIELGRAVARGTLRLPLRPGWG